MISAAEITEDFYSAARLDQCHLDWFKACGVMPAALVNPDPVLRAAVVLVGSQHFDIAKKDDDDCLGAFLFLARDTFGEPRDIIAWAPRHKLLLSWIGVAALLGEDDIYSPSLAAVPRLAVHRTPLEWLQVNRRGVVIVDPTKAAAALTDRGPIIAADPEHARQLRLLLARPEPLIGVRQVEARGVA